MNRMDIERRGGRREMEKEEEDNDMDSRSMVVACSIVGMDGLIHGTNQRISIWADLEGFQG